MKEIEVKFLEIDVKKTLVLLKKIKAKKIFDGEIKSLYFKPKNPKQDFENQLLRLRTKNNESILTHKHRKKNTKAKVAIETEIKTSDPKATQALLEQLGYHCFLKEKRRRTSFKHVDGSIEIDYYPNLPPLLEIEASSLTKINKIAKLLELNPKDAKPWSGREVMKFYNQ